MRSLLVFSLLFVACGDDDAMTPMDGGGGDAAACSADMACDDGLFCNGVETCADGTCAPGDAPCAGACDEAADRCSDCADVDGDGHADAACGGDDCDDTDLNRYPGNEEVCDADDVDEDCDPTTFGRRDIDGDDSTSDACCNEGHCGDDCDDNRAGISPTGTETCNGLDDDCDGAVDEDCVNCVQVTTPGNGGVDNGSPPFASIQAAVDFAANDTNQPNVVCVAPGTGCNASAIFTGAVTMANGIHVYGGYESTNWTRCGAPTTIRTNSDTGVMFDDQVSDMTVLDGFIIERASTATTSGVTVDSGNNVVLSNLEISNTPSVTNSYGINLINQGDALITRVSVYGGNGSAETIAIRSIDSTPTIRDNCNNITATGHCDAWCGTGGQFGIRGRYPNGSGDVHGVYLQDSKDALVESSAICGSNGENGSGIFITGEADGVIVRKNAIDVAAATLHNHGVWMEDCDGDAPWIVDNLRILSNGELSTTEVNSIRAIGNCHPVIDSNEWIVGGGEGVSAGTIGVYCGADQNATSNCVILGNDLIQGSIFGFPPFAMGVKCDDDGCMRIADNVIDGRGGVDAYGLFLGATGTFVDNNEIIGGCGSSSTTGVYAEGAWARLQNNRITSGQCGVDAASNFVGLDVYLDDTTNELDVHSNTIDGRGDSVPCSSVGIQLSSSNMTPPGSSGVYRNNIILGGRCEASAYNIAETDANADPRLLENNNLDPRATPTAFYRNEGTIDLTDISFVNAFADGSANYNISVDSQFATYNTNLHLTAQSMCIAAGTPVGAPAFDMDGDTRDISTPDIGADEF